MKKLLLILLLSLSTNVQAIDLVFGGGGTQYGGYVDLQLKQPINKYVYVAGVAMMGQFGKQQAVYTGNADHVSGNVYGGKTFLGYENTESQYYALRTGAVLPWKFLYVSAFADASNSTEFSAASVEGGINADWFRAFYTYNRTLPYFGATASLNF